MKQQHYGATLDAIMDRSARYRPAPRPRRRWLSRLWLVLREICWGIVWGTVLVAAVVMANWLMPPAPAPERLLRFDGKLYIPDTRMNGRQFRILIGTTEQRWT